MIPFLAAAGLVADPPTAEQDRVLRAIAPLAQERMIVLSDAVGLLGFLFVDDVEIDPAAAEKQLAGADAAEVLDAAAAALRRRSPTGRPPAIEEALKAALVEGLGPQAPAGVRAGAGRRQRPHGLPAAVRVDRAARPGAHAGPPGAARGADRRPSAG